MLTYHDKNTDTRCSTCIFFEKRRLHQSYKNFQWVREEAQTSRAQTRGTRNFWLGGKIMKNARFSSPQGREGTRWSAPNLSAAGVLASNQELTESIGRLRVSRVWLLRDVPATMRSVYRSCSASFVNERQIA